MAALFAPPDDHLLDGGLASLAESFEADPASKPVCPTLDAPASGVTADPMSLYHVPEAGPGGLDWDAALNAAAAAVTAVAVVPALSSPSASSTTWTPSSCTSFDSDMGVGGGWATDSSVTSPLSSSVSLTSWTALQPPEARSVDWSALMTSTVARPPANAPPGAAAAIAASLAAPVPRATHRSAGIAALGRAAASPALAATAAGRHLAVTPTPPPPPPPPSQASPPTPTPTPTPTTVRRAAGGSTLPTPCRRRAAGVAPAKVPTPKPVKRVATKARPKRTTTTRRTLLQKKEDFARISESYAATVMKQSVKKFTSPMPSRFCHVCGRKSSQVPVAACGNLLNGTCRKVLCAHCFKNYGLDESVMAAAIAGTGDKAGVTADWRCLHCTDGCPDSASCRTYKRTNYLRHLTLRGKRMQAAIAAAAAAAATTAAAAESGSSVAPRPTFTPTPAVVGASAAAGTPTAPDRLVTPPLFGAVRRPHPCPVGRAQPIARAASVAATAASTTYGVTAAQNDASPFHRSTPLPPPPPRRSALPPPPPRSATAPPMPTSAARPTAASVSPLDMRLVSRMLEDAAWDGSWPASPVSPPPLRSALARMGLE